MKISVILFRVLFLGLTWLLFTSFFQTSKPNGINEANDYELLELNTDGLYFAEFYDYIFRGHFEELDINRGDMRFLLIFDQYLRAYGAQCAGNLPADKVEIMNEECATEEVTKNGWGDVISRVCIKYVWVGSGIYAKPELYEAYAEIDQIQRFKGLGTMMQMITDPNGMGNSVDMIHKTNGLKGDMGKIFKLNACDSPGLKRFEENLKLFALNKPAVRMDKVSKYTTMKKTGGPTGSQDFNKLINDLVYDQSKTWSFNRYNEGSVSGVTTSSRDSEGRPRELSANYSFSGFSGNNKGSVRITFENGLPKCIYFYDFPQNCKTPNSSIISTYAQGEYAN
ncbi:hypothetical protein [Maribacter hydrothermalis]|uniref:Uncharacterized protein n=1 Tax=Maribacter hydrothermalis TaxID=1836467 RepID=A0A1B7Z8L8_9FLAO|nr:hypothetical protein [Maribacter hydrothermalis]APQ18916.1 hypothetical protein BTR34_17010 [Maribacter hydrothermalis]OBR39071.1 hypothetical protein A9200_05265 [Maribacter hydrothermalis]